MLKDSYAIHRVDDLLAPEWANLKLFFCRWVESVVLCLRSVANIQIIQAGDRTHFLFAPMQH
jgi:hypothetical protein